VPWKKKKRQLSSVKDERFGSESEEDESGSERTEVAA